jgi:O-antigen ligase/tetratricopeptide (TPR) repeat protein
LEIVLLAMACLAPWGLGSVLAQFEIYLSAGVVIVAVLGAVVHWNAGRLQGLLCVPSLALAGLVLLGLFQSLALPSTILRGVAPGVAAVRAQLLPKAPEQVLGDTKAVVPLPPSSISQDRDATFGLTARIASAWIVFQAAVALGGGFAPLRRFAIAISANATLLALFSLIQRLTWNGKIYWIYPAPFNDSGPFVSHNHLAAYLNIGLGFAVGGLLAPGLRDFYQGGFGARLWAGYAAGLIIVGIVASHSRSAFLAMSVAVVFALVVLRPRKGVLLAALGVVLVLVPLLLFVIGGSASYEKRIATILARASYSERFHVWRDSLRAWPTSPIFGTGLGTFSTATARFFRSDSGDRYIHAENEYVEWLVEGGAAGIALIVLTLAGIGRLAVRAYRRAGEDANRALILGASLSAITLLVHSAADFAPHIPGVSVTAVILAAYLCKAGLEVAAGRSASKPKPKSKSKSPQPAPRFSVPQGAIPGVGIVLVSVILLINTATRALAEREITQNTPFALSGSIPLTPDNKDFNWPEDFDWEEATLVREALERSLRYRPNWAEGHLRHGSMLLVLYSRWITDWFEQNQEIKHPQATKGKLGDPTFLFHEAHGLAGTRPLSAEELLANYDPVRLYLVPAARSFLEARRCNPLVPLPYADLAPLDYLLQGGDPARTYLRRALLLGRGDRRLLEAVAQTAIKIDERDVFAEAWRRVLILDPDHWEPVADKVAADLTPEQILEDVVPDGPTTLHFATRLYRSPLRADIRREFLEAAIRRLPNDRALSPAERLRFESEAWVELGERDKAIERMTGALALAPRKSEWREMLVGWLIAWNRPQAAYDIAVEGVRQTPDDPVARRTVEHATTALEQGLGEKTRPR